VIYELLAGAKLFGSEFQLCRYFYGTWPFPEERLRVLSPPTEDSGISLLKAMLAIQPGDRPPAAGALRNQWLARLKSNNGASGSDKHEGARGRDRSTPSRKRKNRQAAYNQPKKKSERGPITQEGTRCIPGGADSGANMGSKVGGNLTVAESSFDSSMMTLSDTAPTGSPAVQTGPRKSEFVSHNIQETHSKSPKLVGKKHIRSTPQTCHPSRT